MRFIITMLVGCAALLPATLSAQTLTDVLIGTTIDTGMNAENVRAMQGIKADARAEVEGLNAYNAALDAEINADSAPSPTTVSGPEVKVRTRVSVVPEPATSTKAAVIPSARVDLDLARGRIPEQALERSPALETVATEGDARLFAEAQMRRDPDLAAIRVASGTVAIERDDTIALFWLFDMKARTVIEIDTETGAIDVDLPWWAKLAGKSQAARSLESLDPKAVKTALSDPRPAQSAVRTLLLVDGAYHGDLAVDAAGAIKFSTSSPSESAQE